MPLHPVVDDFLDNSRLTEFCFHMIFNLNGGVKKFL